jgi:hypothetical protein
MSALSSPFLRFFEISCHLFFVFRAQYSSTPKSDLRWFLCWPSRGDQGSLVIFRSASIRPIHLFDQHFDHDYLFKLPLQGAGCPFTWSAFYCPPLPIPSSLPRANLTRVKASTRGHSATSSTSELPAFVPSLPWQCSVADAWPGVDSGAASPRYNVRRPALPLPARNAIRNCLAS